jgi:hypothetical protein
MDTDFLQKATEQTEGEQGGHKKARRDAKTGWRNGEISSRPAKEFGGWN